jgi:protease I
MGKLDNKRIAFLQTDGVEQVELDKPREGIENEGAETVLVTIGDDKSFQAFNHLDKSDSYEADMLASDAKADDFDGLVLPGGVANPDFLRMDEDAVRFVREFFEQSKPVAAICHGPWTLVEADVLKGRTVTSWPSLQTDIRNAGATWVDEEVHVDEGLVTSRNPDDIPAFTDKAIEEFCEGEHDEQSRSVEAGATSS